MIRTTIQSEIREAVEIVEKLQEWIDSLGIAADEIRANFSWSQETIQISIGDRVLYCDQASSYDDFTFEACKRFWLEYVNSLKPFMGDAT